MNQLIITADDFGLSKEVNEAIEAAHRVGVLTAASLMVGAPGVADAVSRARKLPTLAVGLHIVLVDGASTLGPDRAPLIADSAGRLRIDLARLGVEIMCRTELRRQLRAEIAAQFELYRETGLPLSHVDVHKHYHLHPVVAADIFDIGKRFGMRAIRVPRESTSFWHWTALLRSQARLAKLLTPDAVFGWSCSGSFTRERMISLLDHLPEGLIEIYCHPAMTDDFAGAADGYRYRDEFEALVAPETKLAVLRSGFRLGSYRSAVDDKGSREAFKV